MLVLGIETSCDETAAALLDYNSETKDTILAEEVSSQVKVHEAYGGVVPELAAREHLKNLPLVVNLVLEQAKCQLKDVDLIGVTCGPGLLGCLMLGVNFARGLAVSQKIPLLGVNHIEAHVWSAVLDNPDLLPPFFNLIVSGGHTELHLVHALGSYELISRTQDDAAGEAFDKSASLIGFSYPGGAKLAALADATGHSAFKLPRVMLGASDFSFSGLKTAIALLVEKHKAELASNAAVKGELAHAIQSAIVNALADKVEKAVQRFGIYKVAIGGGVSANQALRLRLSQNRMLKLFFPQLQHCMDNAAMVAYLSAMRFNMTPRVEAEYAVVSRWPIETLS